MESQQSLQTIVTTLISLLSDVTFLPIAAPLVVALTSIVKKFLPWHPGLIAIIFQVAIWATWVFVKSKGANAEYFDSVIVQITTLVSAIGSVVISSYVSTKVYNSSVKNDVPLFGDVQSAYWKRRQTE